MGFFYVYYFIIFCSLALIFVYYFCLYLYFSASVCDNLYVMVASKNSL